MTDTEPTEAPAHTTDTTEPEVVELNAADAELLGEPGADDPDASEPHLDDPVDPDPDPDGDGTRLLVELDDRPDVVVEYLGRRGVRLNLSQRRALGLS